MPSPRDLLFNRLTEIMFHCQLEFVKRIYLQVFSLHEYTLNQIKVGLYARNHVSISFIIGHFTSNAWFKINFLAHIIILEFRDNSLKVSIKQWNIGIEIKTYPLLVRKPSCKFTIFIFLKSWWRLDYKMMKHKINIP